MEDVDENVHLTDEQKEIVRHALTDGFEQGANGYDLSLYRENLRRTPTERIERAQRALELMREVQRAGREHRLSRSTSTVS